MPADRRFSMAARAVADAYARLLRGEVKDAVPGVGQGIALIASEYDLRFSDGMRGARELMAHLYWIAEVRACRECGCTDDAACEEGCSWVEADLCSACEPTKKRKVRRRG